MASDTAADPVRHRDGCPGGFHFGPCWSVGDSCCGKPIGCSVTAESCRMLNHPWKREHAASYPPMEVEMESENTTRAPGYTDTYPMDNNGWAAVSRPFIRVCADEVEQGDLLILDSGLSRVTHASPYRLSNGVTVIHITGPTNVVRATHEIVAVLPGFSDGVTSYRLGNCERCGHSPDWHRLDDAQHVGPTDPDAKFRCLGRDVEKDHSTGSCVCPDYVPVYLDVVKAR